MRMYYAPVRLLLKLLNTETIIHIQIILTTMVSRVLLVGSGLTSAVTCSLLHKMFQKHIHLVIWDKSKRVGGRMFTCKSPTDSNCIADLGAQYITLTEENFAVHNEFYESLISGNLLEPLHSKIEGMRNLPSSTKHFVTPNGSSSLVEHLILDSADEVCTDHQVVAICKQNKNWIIELKSGTKEVFDIVILTMPVPQVLELKGSIQEIIDRNREMKFNLMSVKFSSRYALSLFFSSNYKFNTGWASKYIYDDKVFRYVSLDNQKRNRPDSPTAIVFHTCVQNDENVERDLNDVENELVHHVKKLFPNWPKPSYIKCHKWQYSQVMSPYIGQPGCLTISENPLLVTGGDSFTSSCIDGCISSAIAIANTVVCALKKT